MGDSLKSDIRKAKEEEKRRENTNDNEQLNIIAKVPYRGRGRTILYYVHHYLCNSFVV